MSDLNTLSHTTWRCNYHVVFAPKFRRMVIYGKIKQDIGKILRKLCARKGVTIIEATACPDHIHMLLSIPPKYAVSDFIGYLKGKIITDGILSPSTVISTSGVKQNDTIMIVIEGDLP